MNRLFIIISFLISASFQVSALATFNLTQIQSLKFSASGGNTGFYYDLKGELNLLAINLENRVVVIDQVTGNVVSDFKNSGKLSKISISSDGLNLLAAVNRGNSIIGDTFLVIELSTGKVIHELSDTSKIKYGFFLVNGKIATCSENGNFKIWDVSTGRGVLEKDLARKYVTCSISKDLKRVYIRDYLKEVWTYDIDTNVLSSEKFPVLDHDPGTGLFFEELPLQGGIGFRLESDLTKTVSKIVSPRTRMYPNIWPRISSDLKKIFLLKFTFASTAGSASLLEFPSGKEIASLGEAWNPISGAVFSENGEFLAMVENNPLSTQVNTKMISASDGKELWSKVFDTAVNSNPGNPSVLATSLRLVVPLKIRFSFDGQYVAFANRAGKVSIYRSDSGDELETYKHHAEVNRILFSPDQTKFLSASLDGEVRLYSTGLAPLKMNSSSENLPLFWAWKDLALKWRNFLGSFRKNKGYIPVELSCLESALPRGLDYSEIKNDSCKANACIKTVVSYFQQPWNSSGLDEDSRTYLEKLKISSDSLLNHMKISSLSCP